LIGLLGPVVIRVIQPLMAGVFTPAIATTTADAGLDVASLLWRISAASVLLLALVLGLWLLRRRLLVGRSVTQAGTWDCGYAAPTARMQYTASSFAWPIINMFRLLLQPRLNRRLPSGLFPKQASFESSTDDVFIRYLYAPIFRGFGWLADRLRWVQHGRNQLYVLYIAVTLLILLLWKLGIAL
jgi:hypothetical protein